MKTTGILNNHGGDDSVETTKLFRNVFLSVIVLILASCGEGPGPEVEPVSSPPPPDDVITHSFNKVLVGSTVDTWIKVSNKGNFGTNINVGDLPALPAPFSIVDDICSSKSVPVLTPCSFGIRFAPTAAGSFSHSFDVPTDTPNKLTVKISGTGIEMVGSGNTQLPAIPTGVSATPGDGQITIRWNTIPGTTAYRLYWHTATSTSRVEIANATSPYIHTGLTNGMEYRYVIKAENSNGVSADSIQVAATPSAVSLPPVSTTDWTGTKQFGTASDDQAWSIAVDTSGNVYVAGYTHGNLDGNRPAGLGDAYVAKYSPAGMELWIRQFGTIYTDAAFGVAVDAGGNVYVAGYTDGALDGDKSSGLKDAFVVKYSSAGMNLWTRQFGTVDSDGAEGIAVDVNGNVYVAGYTNGALDGNTHLGSWDAFVVKFDSTGNRLWSTQLGTASIDVAKDITVDIDGNVYMAGHTAGSLDGNIWAGVADTFVVKCNSMGTKLWTRQFGTVDADGAEGIAVDGTGNVYLTGLAQGILNIDTADATGDAFVAKYDSAGVERWIKRFGTASDDYAWDIAADVGGNVYVTGFTQGSLDANTLAKLSDAFVVKYDSTGTELWTRQFGTASDDYALGITVDSGSNIYVAGSTTGALDGNTAAGLEDAFVVKYDSDGGGKRQ